MSTCTVVLPCYNEAARLDVRAFERFAEQSEVNLLLVDDGSSDGTRAILNSLAESHARNIRVHQLGRNVGKAEAVRTGLLEACRASPVPTYVGFWDADLATPLEDIDAFWHLLDSRPDIEMVFGSRVNLLGRSVHRKLVRHYVGRVFATAAAFALGIGIYDTQCGAKLFRVSEGFIQRLKEPFIGGWIFDVEMVAREIRARRGTNLPPADQVIYEFPLSVWRDVSGSKIRASDWIRVGVSLGRIYFRYMLR
jgi:glycosyltransferase involved in cell wall biosynthesis